MGQEERYWSCPDSPLLLGLVTVTVLYVLEGQDEEVQNMVIHAP